MVRNNENVQAKGNSLLRTAASKHLGSGKFASIILRGAARPPVKKVKVSRSDASRVSELTASVVEDVRPTFIKEVKTSDIDVDSSILGMSMASVESLAAKDFGKENPLAGVPKKFTPQPSPFKMPPRKDGKPVEKKPVEIQPGITINTPSPLWLDRVEVQMGQEHSAPESEEHRQQNEEKLKQEELERQKVEYKKAKKEEVERIKEELHHELGEGFELQLDNEELPPARKKSLVKKLLGKIRPKSLKGPMSPNQARALARQAILNSKKKQLQGANGKPPLPNDTQLPLQEITMSVKEDSVSDLESSGRKRFPVKEILMDDGDQSRDDESVSTLGTAHVLERMRPVGQRYGRDIRDPTPTDELEAMGREEMFNPLGGKMKYSMSPAMGANALIDQIDSGTLTEDAEARRNAFAACTSKNQPNRFNHSGPKSFGQVLSAAMCMRPGDAMNLDKQSDGEDSAPEQEVTSPNGTHDDPMSPGSKFALAIDTAISHIKKGTAGRKRSDTSDESTFSGIDLKKTLSPIEEVDDFSPIHGESHNSRKEMPELETYDPENPMLGKRRRSPKKTQPQDGIIDLTNLASPFSPSTDDGIRGKINASPSSFSFDNFMDLAASKLKWKKDDDRYAIEGDESPRQVIHGQNVNVRDRDDDSIPVVQGVHLNKKGGKRNESTPKTSGQNALSNQVSPQSSFEVYEHPEGDVVMWSENPVQPRTPTRTQTPTPKGFAGYFSDGLFDLLSMDESVNRGRKKVPFLSEQPSSSEVGNNKGKDDNIATKSSESAKPCMFGFFDNDVCGNTAKKEEDGVDNDKFKTVATNATRKQKLELEELEVESQDSSDDGDVHEKMDPSVGVMCGAVPLYFMYKQGEGSRTDKPDSPKKVAFSEGKGVLTPKSKGDKEKQKKKEHTKEDVINMGEGSTPKAQTKKGFLPMASPKKNKAELDSNDIIELSEVQNQKPQLTEETPREKVLLAGDDAYWDTLSTIASTKDRSLESAYVPIGLVKPGPIPVEITMKSKLEDDQQTAFEMEQKLTNEEYSTGSWSYRRTDEIPQTTNRRQDNYTEVKIIKSSAGNEHRDPAPYGQPGKGVGGAKDGSDDSSDDTNGLLLAVTRSQGDDAKSPRSGSTPRRDTTRVWSQKDSGKFSYHATQNNDCDDFYAGAKTAIQEAAQFVQDHNISGKQFNFAPESDRKGGLRSYLPKSPNSAPSNNNVPSPKPPQRQAQPPGAISSVLGGQFSNPWKSSNRSVSWGYEAIYEDTTANDPPSNAPQSPSSRAIMTAAAEAAASTAVLHHGNQLHKSSPSSSNNTQSISTKDFSDDEEQELISRTLQLSKQLLASMTAQDLEGADDEVVKSLMSFGTEGTGDKSSLSEVPQAESQRDTSRDSTTNAAKAPTSTQPYRTDESTTLNSAEGQGGVSIEAVADPQEIAARTAPVPSSVQVKETHPARRSPTPSSIRPLGPAPTANASRNQARTQAEPPGQVEPSPSSLTRSEEPSSSSSGENRNNPPPANSNGGNPLFRFPAVFHVLNGGAPSNNQDTSANMAVSGSQQQQRPHWSSLAPGSSSAGFFSGWTGNSPNSQSTSSAGQFQSNGHDAPTGGQSLRTFNSEAVLGSLSPASTHHTDQSSAAPSGQSQESPIDVEALFRKYDNLANHLILENAGLKGLANDDGHTTSSGRPTTRLEQLRAQRAQALAKLHANKQQTQEGNRASSREKDRVSNYGRTLRGNVVDTTSSSIVDATIDESSVTSSTNSTTPSMKARELRRQLDQALQASRNIRQSQAQLETELETFKTRFYKKNDALEDKAMRAIGGM